jgi:hypothetical protein
LVSLFRPGVCSAQKYSFSHYDIEDGLIESQVKNFSDLHLRIKEALNPTRPIVNMTEEQSGHGLTEELPADENSETTINCWRQINR